MADLYKQAFLRGYSDNRNRETDFTFFESVGEIFEKNVKEAKNYFSGFQTVRDRIFFYKTRVMADLANYLIDFESNITKRGAKVIYAENSQDALAEIEKLIPSKKKNSEKPEVFVSNADIFREIGLKSLLNTKNINYFPPQATSLPYPFLPDCKKNIQEKLVGKYGLQESDGEKTNRENAVNLLRRKLVDDLYAADTVITGADFLIADTGAVALSDPDGLETLYTSFCKRHIVVAGIDRLIPSLSELDYFTSMLSSHSFGLLHAFSETVILGPRESGELDGPEELFIILVDNRRTDVLARTPQRSVLNCIGCKACMALCPVFKFSNRMDNPPLKGPLNAVKDPICEGFENNAYLSFACTLCGKCSEICPSKINLHELVLYNRKEAVLKESGGESIDAKRMKKLCKMFLKEKSLNSGNLRFGLRLKFRKMYGTQKEFPNFKQKSFRILWQEKNKI